MQRWLGRANYLNEIVDNRNYLLLFKTMADLQKGELLEVDLLKDSIQTLLDEYLQNCSFINSSRRQQTREIKAAIAKAGTVSDLIKVLTASRDQALGKDIEDNKSRFFKPINLSGTSRYQDTIDNALNLLSAISSQKEQANGIQGLESELKKVVVMDQALSIEDQGHYESIEDTLTPLDKGNAEVVKKSIKRSFERRQNDARYEGMTGRTQFFENTPIAKAKEEQSPVVNQLI